MKFNQEITYFYFLFITLFLINKKLHSNSCTRKSYFQVFLPKRLFNLLICNFFHLKFFKYNQQGDQTKLTNNKISKPDRCECYERIIEGFVVIPIFCRRKNRRWNQKAKHN